MAGLRTGKGARCAGRTLLAGVCATVGSCEPAPEAADPAADPAAAVVRTFFRLYEEHDVQGILALLDEEFTFRVGGGGFVVGRDAIPAMLAWDAAAGSSVEIQELAQSGDTVRVRLRERNRFTEILELEPWRVEATFVVRDGRIRSEVARELKGEGPSFNERFERALAPVVAWAKATRTEDADAVFEGGSVARYDGATARRLLRLLEAYREEATREPPP